MPSIRDFSGGVLNQELQNRDNGNGILFDCKNVLSSWNGELRKRTGTRWLKSLEGNSKIIPYRLPDGDDMIMVLRDKVIKCYKFDDNNNLIPYKTTSGGESIEFPTTGWSSNTNGNWTVSASGLNSEAFYAVSSQAYYLLEAVDNKSMIYGFENQNPVILRSLHIGFVYYIRDTGQPGIKCAKDPIIQYSDDGQNWFSVITKVENESFWYELNISNGWTSYFSFDVTNNDSSLIAHKYWRILFTGIFQTGYPYGGWGRELWFSVSQINFTEIISETDLIFNSCQYENSDFDNIKWSQNNKTLTMTCKGMTPYQIDIENGVFVERDFTPSDYTRIWVELGYPSCVTYYQNRLWFGGFALHPTRIYSSEFGNFDKFTIPSSIVATSPIMVDGTEISGIIENMWGGNNALYCLSEDGISMIDAQGAIVATDHVEFKLRNREPVNAMVPTVKDDIMIYLGRDKRKILITDFDFVVQRFRANCISDNYNNFLQAGIRELHYIPRKSSLVYGTLEDGKWFAQLFSTDKSKNALYPFETNGRVIDIQPIKKGDETKLLMLTQLPSYQYIIEEKIAQPDQKIMDFMTKQEKQDYTQSVIGSTECYLDHSISRAMNVPATTIGNVPYLAGDEVEVVADGQYLGSRVVLNHTNSTLYSWENSSGDIIYTDVENPTIESIIYDNNYSDKTTYSIQSTTVVEDVVIQMVVKRPLSVTLLGYKNTEDEVVYMASGISSLVFDGDGNYLGTASEYSSSSLVYNGETYTRDEPFDKGGTIYTNDSYAKTNNNIGVLSAYIDLEREATSVVMGYKYNSYAVLKFVSPYNMRKFPKEIAVNFINTGYLEVGNTFDSLKSVLNNLVESVTIDNKKILMNGNYVKTLDKQTFETPYVIVRSDKGLPFIITGIDYKVDMSNYQGGV